MVTFMVDGKEVVAKPGTNMIEAAKTVGVDIPYYCYHPRLTIAANCRMCMVESSMAPPGKLVPACQTGIAEGMQVKTTSDKVRAQQKMVMEFLLLNHPVDCSICDQAGECKLQDYYMRYDARPSRLEGGKVLRNKRKALSELVVIDQERCVLCSRCVRFMDEVAKAPQLGIFGRGSHEVVDLDPSLTSLDSNYTGNIVDLCPVGALLNRDFRFKARAWFLSATPSVCTGCARGCTTHVDFMGQDVHRFRPRENEAINKSWLCDQGRLSYHALNRGRVLASVAGRGAEARELGRAEATTVLAQKLKPLVGQPGLAVAVSPTLTNEDLLAAVALARDVLKVKALHVTGRPAGEQDFFLMLADKNPNRTGLGWIARAAGLELLPFETLTADLERGTVKALVAFGQDVPGDAEAFARQASKLELLAVAATNTSPLTAQAHVLMAAATAVEDEGSFTQEAGITQRVRRAFPPRGDAQPVWKWAAELTREVGGQAVPWGSSSREVWKKLAPAVPELASFEWDKLAPLNQLRPGITTMPAGADGRPPGWREQGIPNLRGLTLPRENP
jgi:NADH-quinone oxidoreductase subunit G